MIIIFITGFLTGFSASFTAFNISLYKSNPINAFMNRIVREDHMLPALHSGGECSYNDWGWRERGRVHPSDGLE